MKCIASRRVNKLIIFRMKNTSKKPEKSFKRKANAVTWMPRWKRKH